MSTLKQLHRQARTRRQGKPAFTLLELIVVLLVLGILAAIAVPTFNRVKENSVTRVAQTTLEAIDRNGEALAKSDLNASDEAIATAVESEFTDEGGLTVSVGSGANADTVTVTQVSGSITASGSVEFVDGVGTITAAAISGDGSSSTTSSTVAPSTTSSTVAPTTTTTVAPTTTTTVAAPFVPTVGATGPGGGKIFYVADTPFACGEALAATCTYLEAAPLAGWYLQGFMVFSWSGNTSTAVSGADGTAIGTGYQNTLDIANQSGNTDLNSAAVKARAYTSNGFSDWFLPSKDELNRLYLERVTVGYAEAMYWTSSEVGATTAWTQEVGGNGNQMNWYNKTSTYVVHPVRAG